MDRWEADHLFRIPTSSGFEVHSAGRTWSAVEFAAVTQDSALVRSFRDRDRASRRESRGMLIVGGLLAGVGLTELIQVTTLGEDPIHAEDHLWRGAICVGVSVLPLTFSLVPVQVEQARRRSIPAVYSAEETDDRIRTYNAQLRTSLGLPPEATATTGVTVVLPPSPAAP